jgi:hypothetical protein
MNKRAVKLFFQKQNKRAIELLQTAVELSPNYRQAYFNLGFILALEKRESEAAEIF